MKTLTLYKLKSLALVLGSYLLISCVYGNIGNHTLFIKEDGSLWSTGFNAHGQLGLGDYVDRNITQAVSGITGVKNVTTGLRHSFFIKQDGTVWCMGYNSHGQLGLGDVTRRNSPEQVPGSTGLTQISAGQDHSLFLKNDGSILSMGKNESGQLGLGDNIDRNTSSLIQNISNVTQISSGRDYNLFLKSDGTVWGMGRNLEGQLGLGNNLNQNSPVQIPGIDSVIQISAGGATSLLLKSDGTVWVSGYNSRGQLGLGDTNNRNSVVQISNLTDIIQISAGSSHNLMLKNDGTVWVNGFNSYGQLGLGDLNDRNQSVQINGLDDVVSITATEGASYLLKSDGSLWAMGRNHKGQLGDGTIIDKNTPVLIASNVSRLSDIFNKSPTDLNSTGPFAITENQPIGTIVGEFNATDLDANATLTYSLVGGNGSTDNSLFILESNGTLKTATTFDYESNASSYSIRVQVKDEYNATTEEVFSVSLSDVFEDRDGDGFSDQQESTAGTNPDSNSSIPDLNFDLIAWYPMDGNASDISGNGHHGVVNGATLSTDRNGNANKAYSFDGTNDYIELGNLLAGKKQFSISAWIKTTQLDSGGGEWYKNPAFIGTRQSSGKSNDFLFNIRSGRLAWHDEFSSGMGTYWSRTFVANNEWWHVVATRNNQDLGIYANARRQASISIGENGVADAVIDLGRSLWTGSIYFAGAIDEVRIYKRSLLAGEVLRIYESERQSDTDGDGFRDYQENLLGTNPENGFNKPDGNASLITHYTFDGDFNDQSGNGNHAENHGPIFAVDRFGESGKALLFDGMDDRLKIPHTILHGRTDFSYNLWLRMADEDSPFVAMLSCARQWEGNEFLLLINNSNKRLHLQVVNNGQSIYWGNPQNFSEWVNIWRMVTFTRDHSQFSVYLDGNLKTNVDHPNLFLEIDENGTWIGPDQDSVAGGWDPTQHLKGSIDDVRLYDRALTSYEVKSLFLSEKVNESPTLLNGQNSLRLSISESSGSHTISPGWDRTFGGSGTEEVFDGIITPDGGYLFVGTSDSNATGNKSQNSRGGKDYWALKIDSLGNKIWDKRYGGTANDHLSGVSITHDNGYLLVGRSISGIGGDKTEASKGFTDYWVVKIDENGSKLWDKTLGGSRFDYCSDVIVTPENGFILTGRSQSWISGDKTEDRIGGYDYWVVKIDSQGNKVWDRTFGGSDTEYCQSIAASDDGGYLLAGSSYSQSGHSVTDTSRGEKDFWVVKIDASGNKIWDKRYGGNGSELLIQAIPSGDGGFLLAGLSQSSQNGDLSHANRGIGDYWIIKVDQNGSKLWDQRYGGNQWDILKNVSSQPDGGYLILGYSDSIISGEVSQSKRGEKDYWAIKVDALGNKLWDRRMGSEKDDYGKIVLPTRDGGYLLGGHSLEQGVNGEKQQANYGGSDFWIVKIDADGNQPLHASDPDGDPLAWSISGGVDAAKFSLNATTGELTLHSTDYENPTDADGNNTYEVELTVTDSGNLTASRSVIMTVSDLYEPSQPNFSVASVPGLEMIWVEPGTFTMGSPSSEAGRSSDETEHSVTLSQGFYLGKYEVTQAQYTAVMTGNPEGLNANPSHFSGENRPVEKVSWNDIQVFCQRLNKFEQNANRLPNGWAYGLPTEAEWEYACRAGTTTPFSWGNQPSLTHANYKHDTSLNRTVNVGLLESNPWGFHDMHGNLREWTADWYQAVYSDASLIDPSGPESGSTRVQRGGSWGSTGSVMRSATRGSNAETNRLHGLGFRLAYKQVTHPPTALTLSANTILENQPVGTVIGMFSARDPRKIAQVTAGFDNAVKVTAGMVNASDPLTFRGITITGFEAGGMLLINELTEDVQNLTCLATTADMSIFGTITLSQRSPDNKLRYISLAGDVYEANLEDSPSRGYVLLHKIGSVSDHLSYTLVSETGNGNALPFTLQPNGTLQSNKVFDYESDPHTYSLRVRSHSPDEAYTEKNFTVGVVNINEVPTGIAISDSFIPYNQPAGTIIGKLSAIDQDSDEEHYYTFVNETGNLDQGLLSYYPLDGNAKDLGSGANDGVVIGTVQWADGKVGKSMKGDANNFIQVASSETNTLGENAGRNWTISLWFKKMPSTTKWRNFFSKRGGNSGSTDYAIATERGHIYWGTGAASDSNAWMKIAEPALEIWHHIAATISQTTNESGSKAIYLNGSMVKSGNYRTKAASSANLVIGRIDSYLDEVRVYNRVLNENEIGKLHELGSQGKSKISDNELFSLDQDGTLRTTKLFSPESEPQTFTIRVRATGEDGSFTEETMTFETNSLQDAPTGLMLSSNTIHENQPVGTVIGMFSAQDPRKIAQFTTGFDNAVDVTPGMVDYDNIKALVFRGIALTGFELGGVVCMNELTENVQPTSCAVATADFSIAGMVSLSQASNDNKLGYISTAGDIYEADLEHNPEIGYVLLHKIGSVSDHLSYTLVSETENGDALPFTLQPNGTLQSNRVFDYESDPHTYSLRVRSSSQFGAFTENTFTVELTDEEDTPVDLRLSQNTILENQPAGTIIGKFSARDPRKIVQFTAGFDYQNIKVTAEMASSTKADGPPGISINGFEEGGIVFMNELTENVQLLSCGVATADFSISGMVTLGQASNDNKLRYISLAGDVYEADLEHNPEIGYVLLHKIGSVSEQLSYELVNEPGNGDTLPFTLQPNGTLQSNRVFDYESDPLTYSLRVRAVDEPNAVEKDFTVSLTDEHQPLVRTSAHLKKYGLSYQFSGEILADWGTPVLHAGFEISENLKFSDPWLLSANLSTENMQFSVNHNLPVSGKRYYYRAYATNAEGTSYGSPKKLKTPEVITQYWWTEISESPAGWRTSDWFGSFLPYNNGWIYHAKMGWAFAQPDGSNGLWLWAKSHGWLWTKEGVWPYLFQNTSANWLYFITKRNGRPYFYDYSTESLK